MVTTHLVVLSFFDGASVAGSVVAAPTTAVVGGGKSRRRRSFIELEGQLVEVSGYEEAERLLTELKQEEKAQEKDRKKLRISAKKYEVDIRTPGRKPEKPEVIEQRMDDRADRIAQLYILIQRNLEDEISNDDEEVLLLS